MEKLVAIAYISVIFYPFFAPVFYLIIRNFKVKDFYFSFLITTVFLSILGYSLAIAISYYLFYVENLGVIQEKSESVLGEIVINFFYSPLTISLYFITSGILAVAFLYNLKPKLD
ncbi:MAG: hypothetical protein MUF43_14170 [Flavobacterium sp.]|nr:hypothetical protein [Flavobacterium sp.]MCU0394124.1 hypothetical protein [Thermoflexibacter sp.]